MLYLSSISQQIITIKIGVIPSLVFRVGQGGKIREERFMSFSIELHFDEKSNLIIRNMWKKLRERGISAYMDQYGGFPHIALAVFNDIDILEIERLIKKVIEDESMFNIKMSSLGIFPSNESVLFLSPAASATLINLHSKLHGVLKEIEGKWDYYLPDFWVPHCTLGMNIAKSKIHDALDVIIEDYEPFDAKVETIQLVEFNPVKLVKSFRFRV